jgi:hypothetical protein
MTRGATQRTPGGRDRRGSAPSKAKATAADRRRTAAGKRAKLPDPATLRRVEPTRRPVHWSVLRVLRAVRQPLCTLLVVLLWLGLMVVYVTLVAPYNAYGSALFMGVGLAVFSGIAVHLWSPRTAPWRTVAWAALVSAFAGAELLISGAGRLALTGAMLIGFAVVLLRINSNGRRLVGLFRNWRALR